MAWKNVFDVADWKLYVKLSSQDSSPDPNSVLYFVPIEELDPEIGTVRVLGNRIVCDIKTPSPESTEVSVVAVPLSYTPEAPVRWSVLYDEQGPTFLPDEEFPVDQNVYHEVNPGAYRLVVPLNGNAAAKFKIDYRTYIYAGRLIVNPLTAPEPEGIEFLDYAETWNQQGELYDSGWLAQSEGLRDSFYATLDAEDLPKPNVTVAVPLPAEFSATEPLWGLEIIHTYHGAGGPGHTLWGADITYPFADDQQYTVLEEPAGALMGEDSQLYYPSWVVPPPYEEPIVLTSGLGINSCTLGQIESLEDTDNPLEKIAGDYVSSKEYDPPVVLENLYIGDMPSNAILIATITGTPEV